MRFVFSITASWEPVIRKFLPPNVLVSQVYDKARMPWMKHCELFIYDSGAFSLWNAGKDVDFDEYIQKAKLVSKWKPGSLIVNLDVIPGTKGNAVTAQQVENACAQSLENADLLRSRHLRVTEVFHQGESYEFFRQLLERAEGDVVCVAPRQDLSIKKRVEWLKWLRTKVLSEFGKENFPKIHGLACTGHSMLINFPFYSVDSSSWANGARFGTIATYNHKVSAQHISEELPDSRPRNAQVFAIQKTIISYMEQEKNITQLWAYRGITFQD